MLAPDSAKLGELSVGTAEAKYYGRVTLRAVALALALTVVNDYWIVQLEVVRYSFATYAAAF